jgi:hypothetical protein
MSSVNIISPRLAEITCKCFGESAFLMASVVDQKPQVHMGMKGLVIEYRGIHQGELVVYLSPETLSEMTLNMLGMNEPDIELAIHMINDAICEFGNLLVGHLLTDIYGEDQDLRVGLPALIDEAVAPSYFNQYSNANEMDLTAHQTILLDVEGWPAVIEIRQK